MSESSIQLAGGAPGDQKSHQRDTANQMLESTNANLKKIAGQKLTANQQDMVSQTRQFMAQAKVAVDAGDLERARTLAWKAQLLSEELVKPQQ
jgi:iron uptake system EfeUOB component EfeO/EfeM